MIISLCDTEVKNQVKALQGYKEISKKLDLMTLLEEIKKIVFTGGSDNLHMKHNEALCQEKFQDIQDFQDRYMAICKVCTKLGLTFG